MAVGVTLIGTGPQGQLGPGLCGVLLRQEKPAQPQHIVSDGFARAVAQRCLRSSAFTAGTPHGRAFIRRDSAFRQRHSFVARRRWLVQELTLWFAALMVQGVHKFKQYQVVGRHLPTEIEANPTVYRMKVWAEDEVRAKSKFW